MARHIISENGPLHWAHILPQLDAHTHKYSRGHALIYGGTYMTGAARLSAMACARAGAGATTVACNQTVWPIYAGHLLSVIVTPWQTTKEATALLASTYGAVLIGPGATHMPELSDLIIATLDSERGGRAVVLDADALTIYRNQPTKLFSLIRNSQAKVVLTPHEGEFARLFSDLAVGQSSLSKVERAQQAAQRSGAIVVLKGSETVIAQPTGETLIQKGSTPYLATAGSGDVLAGLITGLSAQAMPPFFAACAAVWLHNQAALAFGPGLIADDLITYVPKAWQYLFSML